MSETPSTHEQHPESFPRWDVHEHDWPPPEGDSFGNCPVCGAAGMEYDLGWKDEWLACDEHRIAWSVGSVSTPAQLVRGLSEEEAQRMYAENRARLQGYRVIDPFQAVAPDAWRRQGFMPPARGGTHAYRTAWRGFRPDHRHMENDAMSTMTERDTNPGRDGDVLRTIAIPSLGVTWLQGVGLSVPLLAGATMERER